MFFTPRKTGERCAQPQVKRDGGRLLLWLKRWPPVSHWCAVFFGFFPPPAAKCCLHMFIHAATGYFIYFFFKTHTHLLKSITYFYNFIVSEGQEIAAGLF